MSEELIGFTERMGCDLRIIALDPESVDPRDREGVSTFKEIVHRAVEAEIAYPVIDLSRVNFIGSTTLAVLIGALRGTRHYEGQMKIVTRADSQVHRTLTTLGRLFEIETT